MNPFRFSAGAAPASFITSWFTDSPANPTHSQDVLFAAAGTYVINFFVIGPTNSDYVAVTVNGVAATLRKRNTTVNSAYLVGHFEIVIATPGTYAVAIEWQGGSNMTRLVGACSFVGSKSFVTSSESVANPVDLSMNTVADDVFVGMAASDAGTVTFDPTGFTENYEHIVDISRTAAGGMNLACTGATPETFSMAITGTPGNIAAAGVLYR